MLIRPSLYRPRMPSLTQGLVGWWPLDGKNTSPTTAFDSSSGNGNNGSLVGAPRLVGGLPFGEALSFNGGSQYVITSSNIQLYPSITVSALVRPTVSSQGTFSRIAETDFGAYFYLGTDSSGTKYNFIVFGNNGGSLDTCSGGTIVAGQRTLVTATYSAGTEKLYVDRTLVAQASTLDPNTALPLYISSSDRGPGSFGWNGAIGDVRIYNRALSAGEVLALYAEAFQPQDQLFKFLASVTGGGGGTSAALAARLRMSQRGRAGIHGVTPLQARALTTLEMRAAAQYTASLRAKSKVAVEGKAPVAATTSLKAKTITKLKGKAPVTGLAALGARVTTRITGLVRNSTMLALKARLLTTLHGRSSPAGSTALRARSAMDLYGKSRAQGATGLKAASKLSFRGTANLTKGLLLIASRTVLALRGKARVAANSSLSARGKLAARGRAGVAGSTGLKARSSVKLSGRAPIAFVTFIRAFSRVAMKGRMSPAKLGVFFKGATRVSLRGKGPLAAAAALRARSRVSVRGRTRPTGITALLARGRAALGSLANMFAFTKPPLQRIAISVSDARLYATPVITDRSLLSVTIDIQSVNPGEDQ